MGDKSLNRQHIIIINLWAWTVWKIRTENARVPPVHRRGPAHCKESPWWPPGTQTLCWTVWPATGCGPSTEWLCHLWSHCQSMSLKQITKKVFTPWTGNYSTFVWYGQGGKDDNDGEDDAEKKTTAKVQEILLDWFVYLSKLVVLLCLNTAKTLQSPQ